MLETFHARVDAGMERTMQGEDTCPCAIFTEITGNGDVMNFLYQVWNGALVALVEYLPDASLGKIEPSGLIGGEAGDVVERLANGPDGTGGGGFGESLRHVIILAAAAGWAAALDTEAGVGMSSPEDDLEAFLQALMAEAAEHENGGDAEE